MAWDSSRPVPWTRLVREWLLYAAIMSGVFLVFFRDSNPLGAIAGVLISGPIYVALGAVLAKFGYTRTRLKDVRTAQTEQRAAAESAIAGVTPRQKPAPTSRTAGGGNRPSNKRKR